MSLKGIEDTEDKPSWRLPEALTGEEGEGVIMFLDGWVCSFGLVGQSLVARPFHMGTFPWLPIGFPTVHLALIMAW